MNYGCFIFLSLIIIIIVVIIVIIVIIMMNILRTSWDNDIGSGTSSMQSDLFSVSLLLDKKNLWLQTIPCLFLLRISSDEVGSVICFIELLSLLRPPTYTYR